MNNTEYEGAKVIHPGTAVLCRRSSKVDRFIIAGRTYKVEKMHWDGGSVKLEGFDNYLSIDLFEYVYTYDDNWWKNQYMRNG